jgi:hypothetical protein
MPSPFSNFPSSARATAPGSAVKAIKHIAALRTNAYNRAIRFSSSRCKFGYFVNSLPSLRNDALFGSALSVKDGNVQIAASAGKAKTPRFVVWRRDAVLRGMEGWPGGLWLSS